MRVNANKQLETQLLAEWRETLPAGWQTKTHVHVSSIELLPQFKNYAPNMLRAVANWNDWADMRIFTGSEVWLVEGTIVNNGKKYGQLQEYLAAYPSSTDYQQFKPAPIVGIVLCAFERAQSTQLFAGLGIRTVVFTPSWANESLYSKVLNPGGTVGNGV
jgi:hypothetical protein